MYVPEKMKLNKFKLVAIPKKMEYFQRFGLTNTVPLGTGEEPVPTQERKMEQIRQANEVMEQFDKERQKEAEKGEKK